MRCHGPAAKVPGRELGFTAARIVLTQFGFAHGWRMADAIREKFKWASAEEPYEAEQHLLRFGRSDAADCWTISGLLSGYLSRQLRRH